MRTGRLPVIPLSRHVSAERVVLVPFVPYKGLTVQSGHDGVGFDADIKRVEWWADGAEWVVDLVEKSFDAWEGSPAANALELLCKVEVDGRKRWRYWCGDHEFEQGDTDFSTFYREDLLTADLESRGWQVSAFDLGMDDTRDTDYAILPAPCGCDTNSEEVTT